MTHDHQFVRRIPAQWLTALSLAAISALGCGHETVLHPYDKAPLEALRAYQPVYELNNDGRVVDLKLNHKKLDAVAFDQMAKLTALHTLSLYGSSITDDNLKKLDELGELRALGLGATEISDKGLEHLRNVPNLRWLWINGDKGVTRAAVDKLKQAHPQLVVYR